MTKYPHWINEEVINQKEIDLAGYRIHLSIVYASESMVLFSVRDTMTTTSSLLVKNYLAGTIVSKSLRLCKKAISTDSSSPSIIFSLFNMTSEIPFKHSFWPETLIEANWSTMLLVCDTNHKNIALLKFLSETTPVYTNCYQCCFFSDHFHPNITFEIEMSYEMNRLNNGLDEESILWLPERKVTLPEDPLFGIPFLGVHDPSFNVVQEKTLGEDVEICLTKDESE